MFIQTEQTPNPNSLKFLPGEIVMKQGTADFRSAEAASNSPLAKRFFRLNGVEGVFFGHDFISITKSDDKDWMVLKPLILGMIMDHFTNGTPLFDQEKQTRSSSHSENQEDDELVIQIKELLDTRIRPAVAMDGGDIVFESFQNGVVFLKLQGACAGCPSSTITLKAGIENMLRHYIPEVVEVRAVA